MYAVCVDSLLLSLQSIDVHNGILYPVYTND